MSNGNDHVQIVFWAGIEYQCGARLLYYYYVLRMSSTDLAVTHSPRLVQALAGSVCTDVTHHL